MYLDILGGDNQFLALWLDKNTKNLKLCIFTTVGAKSFWAFSKEEKEILAKFLCGLGEKILQEVKEETKGE